VDWFLDPPVPATASRLRQVIAGYLRRHCVDQSQVWAAEAIAGELIGNAISHAGGPVWVSLDWSRPQPVLAVHDLGPTFELAPRPPELTAEHGRGLWMVSQLVTDLAVAAKRAGGKRVSATLPVERAENPPCTPTRLAASPLPSLPETVNPLPTLLGTATPGFDRTTPGYDREALLRALVVALTLAVEETHGPLATQLAVARVGASVASQAERDYRQARQLVEPLSPQQIADCCLELKAGIGGRFSVTEVRDDRIVLRGTRCPFEATVRSQPSLCRLTSSVVGGIAARNVDQAAVVLEERIALGDPECRVVILLGDAAIAATAEPPPTPPPRGVDL
jgi:hypothetical protein